MRKRFQNCCAEILRLKLDLMSCENRLHTIPGGFGGVLCLFKFAVVGEVF